MNEAWSWVKEHKWLAIGGGVGVFAIVLLLSRGSSAPADTSGAQAYEAQEAAAAAANQNAAQLSASENSTGAQLSAVQDQDAAAVSAAQIQSNTALGLGALQLQDDTQQTAATTAQTQIAADSAAALATIAGGVTTHGQDDQLSAITDTNLTQYNELLSNNATQAAYDRGEFATQQDEINQSAASLNLQTTTTAQTTALSIAAQEAANASEAALASQSIASSLQAQEHSDDDSLAALGNNNWLAAYTGTLSALAH